MPKHDVKLKGKLFIRKIEGTISHERGEGYNQFRIDSPKWKKKLDLSILIDSFLNDEEVEIKGVKSNEKWPVQIEEVKQLRQETPKKLEDEAKTPSILQKIKEFLSTL
jgi:hypothetical protein